MAAILNFDIFQKILKMAIFRPKTSVTPLHICFWGQGIYLWGYFLDLIKITGIGDQNCLFWGKNGVSPPSTSVFVEKDNFLSCFHQSYGLKNGSQTFIFRSKNKNCVNLNAFY